MPGGALHDERALCVVTLEGLREVGLVEFAAASPLDRERGGIRRQAHDEAVAHGVRGLEAHMAALGALPEGQHEDETLGVGHPCLLRELARSQDAFTAHAERPAAVAAEVALPAVPGFAFLDDGDRAAARAALDPMVGPGAILKHCGADNVSYGFDGASPLRLVQLRHIALEGGYQIFGVHDAPIPRYLTKVYHCDITRMPMLV